MELPYLFIYMCRPPFFFKSRRRNFEGDGCLNHSQVAQLQYKGGIQLKGSRRSLMKIRGSLLALRKTMPPLPNEHLERVPQKRQQGLEIADAVKGT